MPEEENKKLRDLVSETLQTKGVLGRIQAEIRASVFLALEEQDVFKDKSPFINKQLKDYLKTSDGMAVISLVREFLEFFNLEFSLMVFDPETNAGFDYNYEGRTKLANTLKINDCDKGLPLLSHVLKHSKPPMETHASNKEDRLPKELIQPTHGTIDTNGQINNISTRFTSPDEIFDDSRQGISTKSVPDKFLSHNLFESHRSSLDSTNKIDDRLFERNVKESIGAASLTSLSNLPPIGKPSQADKKEQYDLKSLLDISTDRNFEDDNLSSDSDVKKDSKLETGSDESEVEEEISANSNLSAQPDDNTTDASVSKLSGHGDYLENL